LDKKSSRELTKTWPYKRYAAFEKVLRDAASKWFEEKGFMTKSDMPYCLESFGMWDQNLITEGVREYIKEEIKNKSGNDPFPAHKYLHHGLSSQAMGFNLIGSMAVLKDFTPLRQVLEEKGIELPGSADAARFEDDDRNVFNEDVGQPTSIDVAFTGREANVFIEVKLAEKEFGGCSIFGTGDCAGANPCNRSLNSCFLHHIGRKYWVLAKEKGLFETDFFKGPICPFASNYQFFRELLYALEKKGSYVLLHDARSPVFTNEAKVGVAEDGTAYPETGLWPMLVQSLPKEAQSKVARVTVQEVLKAGENRPIHKDWIAEFKKKYGIV
jgi:hypothetical protein